MGRVDDALEGLGRGPAVVHADPPAAWPAPWRNGVTGFGRATADGWTVYPFGPTWIAAGPPARRRTLAEPWGHGALPAPLWAVLRLHDGVGPVGVPRAPFGVPRLLPVDQVAPLTRWMRFGEEGILYAPASWIRFTIDLEGGFCMSAGGEVRWWSSGTHALGDPVPLHAVWRDLARAWRAG